MPQTSRAACALLCAILEIDVLPYSSISREINNMVTASNTNGPALLVDSSVALMQRVLYLRNTHLPSASQATSHSLIRWVFSKWEPSMSHQLPEILICFSNNTSVANLAFLSSQSPQVSPVDICALLSTCSGSQMYNPSSCVPLTGGPLARAWAEFVGSEPIMRFLLLVGEAPDRLFSWSQTGKTMARGTLVNVADTSNFHSAKKLILELLHPVLEDVVGFAERWNKRERGQREGSSHISVERLHSHFSFCIACSLLIPDLQEVSSRQSQDLGPEFLRGVEAMFKAVSRSSHSQEFTPIILKAIRPVIPTLSGPNLAKHSTNQALFNRLLAEVSAFAIQRDKSRRSDLDADVMDLDDDFGSQGSHSSASSHELDVPRTKLFMALNTDAFLCNTSAQVHYMAAISKNPDQTAILPGDFLDHVLGLPDREFLAIASFLNDLLATDLVISPDDGYSLLEKASEIIMKDDYQNCEIALCNCLGLMRGLSAAGQDEEHELHRLIVELYEHFISTFLPGNCLSQEVQADLVNTLFFFLHVGTDYGIKGELPACWSSLLSMLKKGPIHIKYAISARLPNLLALYVLKTHDDIFMDCLACLPLDADFLEGMAVRLFALAELGCRWPSLLRRCIYYIFETPARVPESSSHATQCLSKISQALSLGGAKELFRLFSPQLLYTWLENSALDSIPHDIFGFESLKDLLEEAKEEAAALMVMRDQEQKMTDLAQALGIKPVELIGMSFARIMAYSIGHDLSSFHQEHSTVETRLKKTLGKERFMELLYINFVDILSISFQTYDDRDEYTKVNKQFSRHEYTRKVLATLKEIRNTGHSDVDTPPSQQPSYKARQLPNQLLYLSTKTKWDLMAKWSPTLVVALARRLFNTIHPALGSLHACVVIRRIRILIAFAGDTACDLYPLQMLLHSLRPLMVDPECADDSLGISEYLLRRGKENLQSAPSFLAGYALSALASLRVFLDSSQSSTTQESQFRATMDKAQKFHSWFTQYLAEYDSPAFKDESLRKAFTAISTSAAHIRSFGNADRETHESNLLLEILTDGERESKLLNESARELALGMLCGRFHMPLSSRQDMVESDQEALDLEAAVWRSCHASALSDNYLSWAGRLVGKSFAASGEIPARVLRESIPRQHVAAGSEFAILALLRGLTMSSDSRTAGLAESTIRSIITLNSAAEDGSFASVSEKVLGEHLVDASTWGDFEAPPSDVLHVARVPESRAFSDDSISSPSWASWLGTQLAQLVSGHVVLRPIAAIVARVESFAHEALPFIMHLVLISQLRGQRVAKRSISAALPAWLQAKTPQGKDNVKLLIHSIMYLRTQRIPGESSIAERMQWLDLDLSMIAVAAARCDMFKTALLLAELAASGQTRSYRRSSLIQAADFSELLLDIYQNIDDPDAYYGLPQDPSLSSVLSRLEYEKDGPKSLAFRGAQLDSNIRLRDLSSLEDTLALVKALGNLGLTGLSHSLIQAQQGNPGVGFLEDTFATARRLEIWNLPAPVSTDNHAVSLYIAYQGVYQSRNVDQTRQAVHTGLTRTMKTLISKDQHIPTIRQNLRVLAALSELYDILSAETSQDLDGVLEMFEKRSKWMRRGR